MKDDKRSLVDKYEMENYKRAIKFYPIHMALVGLPFLIFSLMFFIKGIEYKYPFSQIILSFLPLLFFGLIMAIVEFSVMKPMRKKVKNQKHKKK